MRVQEIAQQILDLKKDSDLEIFFVDKSHFSTEPYVIRGWYRKDEDFFPGDKSQQTIHLHFWRIQTSNKIFLLEDCKKSDKQTFNAFLSQLMSHNPDRKTVLIPDNASIHICKYIKDFASKNPNIAIFTLPTYSPEYNPTEQVLRWITPRVCALPEAINGACKEFVSRIRIIISSWIFGRLAKNPKIGIGIWQDLLFNYL